jgi:hypothetical protein
VNERLSHVALNFNSRGYTEDRQLYRQLQQLAGLTPLDITKNAASVGWCMSNPLSRGGQGGSLGWCLLIHTDASLFETRFESAWLQRLKQNDDNLVLSSSVFKFYLRLYTSGESLIDHVHHPSSRRKLQSNCANKLGVAIAERMQPWKDHNRTAYTEDIRATQDIRARFGADATGVLVGGASGGGGAGMVRVHYVVHKVVSSVPDLSEVIGDEQWAQVQGQCAASLEALRR